MDTQKILVVDDDINICELLRLYIEKASFSVITAHNGVDAIKTFEKESPDLILLDIMLPGLDGWQVCREIRKTSNCPIIMLTAKGEVFDTVLGLELGADDYITKPFETREVIARIKAVLRRTGDNNSSKTQTSISLDKLFINLDSYELKIENKTLILPKKEMELLIFLVTNPNKVYTRDKLLQEIWGFDYFGDSRTVDVHIKRLRTKLDGLSDQWGIKTVWGVGYRFEIKS